jgi:hypothetical protein
MRSSLIAVVSTYLHGRTEENIDNPQLGWPLSENKFELSSSLIALHQTKATGNLYTGLVCMRSGKLSVSYVRLRHVRVMWDSVHII